jgi:mannitol/fructose-specific phosphotransferase system IIA component (Ntr-type)
MITELLRDGVLAADLPTESKAETLEWMAGEIARRRPEIDRDHLLATLVQREAQASTALGEGVAIPHARIVGLPTMVGAFARSRAGIEWDAADGGPAHLVLMLAGPAEQPGTYLKMLAGASRLLRDRELRARLLAARDTAELFAVLHDGESGQGAAGPGVNGK